MTYEEVISFAVIVLLLLMKVSESRSEVSTCNTIDDFVLAFNLFY